MRRATRCGGIRNKSLELFRHAAPELKDALNAQGILWIPLSIEQWCGFYGVGNGDEFAN
jgi:hypothetical protein